jgi:hypothetical protein
MAELKKWIVEEDVMEGDIVMKLQSNCIITASAIP